jgi:hypothetical protein
MPTLPERTNTKAAAYWTPPKKHNNLENKSKIEMKQVKGIRTVL